MDEEVQIPNIEERNKAFIAYVQALIDAFQQTGIDARRIGYIVTMEEFAAAGFGFAETQTGNSPWFANTGLSLRTAEELHSVMGGEWDTILTFIDLDKEQVEAKFFTEDERSSWLEEIDDYDVALEYYLKWIESENL